MELLLVFLAAVSGGVATHYFLGIIYWLTKDTLTYCLYPIGVLVGIVLGGVGGAATLIVVGNMQMQPSTWTWWYLLAVPIGALTPCLLFSICILVGIAVSFVATKLVSWSNALWQDDSR